MDVNFDKRRSPRNLHLVNLLRVVWVCAVLFSADFVVADEPIRPSPDETSTWPWDYDVSAMSAVAHWAREADLTLRINSDPVLRAIVCRLAVTNFTMDMMVTATGVSKERITHAVNILSSMKLAQLVVDRHGNVAIVPTSEEARGEMAQWADRWCSSDETCGVGR